MDVTDVRIWRRAADLEEVRVAPDFGAIVRSDRLAPVLRAGFRFDAVTLAAVVDDTLVGYATLVPSSALAGERWESLPDTFELGGLEVARGFRRRRIATALLESLDRCMPLERVVVFARALVSHWDLSWEKETVGASALARRALLLRLLRRAGFAWQNTDDPDITMDAPSFLAVRYGLDAPSSSVLAFHERLMTDVADPPKARAG
jgi:GNAT superfamily N-acetyltransferase